MKKRLWVLHPLLLASTLPALAAQSDEDSIIVSANRTHRTVAEMAQTTWVIEGQEIEQQVQGGKEFKDVLAQLIPGIDVSSQGRTNYGMNMRGRAIVVLIDGVRLNSSRTDSRQLDAIKGGKTDYDNFLFNAGIVAHLTERQQTWFNFSQGVELPDPGKYYGIGKYGAAVNGHLPLISSVNVDDSPLQGIKVNSYELGWRYTGDNLRTQLAAYYSTSDKTIVVNRTDMTIDVQSDKRRIYGVEGAVDYFIPDSDWSVGGNFNVLKSQVQTDGRWQKWDVTLASPSKATAWVGWAPDPWSLRVQSQQVFDLSDAAGNKLEGYNTVDFIGSYALPVGKVTFSIENLLNEDYVTIWGQRAPLLYSPTYGSSSLYEYKGRGRTFGLNYALTF
ncbi:TPA: TonB-dependent receptor domain-containing protein [Klebsiella pneumoniae]